MTDRDVPSLSDIQILQLPKGSEWIPHKTLVVEQEGFRVFKSDPADSQNGTIQFAIRESSGEDLIRIDSYQEGYFGASWPSGITFEQFLELSEEFLAGYEDQLALTSEAPRLGVFTAYRAPEFYEVTRPLLKKDFKEVFLGDENHPLGLVRYDTDVADFCYMPGEREVGMIAWLNDTKTETLIQSATRFVVQTQGRLPEGIIAKTLNMLPYKRTLDNISHGSTSSP